MPRGFDSDCCRNTARRCHTFRNSVLQAKAFTSRRPPSLLCRTCEGSQGFAVTHTPCMESSTTRRPCEGTKCSSAALANHHAACCLVFVEQRHSMYPRRNRLPTWVNYFKACRRQHCRLRSHETGFTAPDVHNGFKEEEDIRPQLSGKQRSRPTKPKLNTRHQTAAVVSQTPRTSAATAVHGD